MSEHEAGADKGSTIVPKLEIRRKTHRTGILILYALIRIPGFSGAQVKRSNFVSWLVVNSVSMLVRAVTPVVVVHSRNQHQSDGFARPF